MTEITKLDNKYFVVKQDDLDRFFSQFTSGIFTTKEERRYINKIPFNTVLKKIQAYRKSMGKKDNHYLVLNLDDEIDLRSLIGNLMESEDIRFVTNTKVQVNDIAVALVNAILKAKEKT